MTKTTSDEVRFYRPRRIDGIEPVSVCYRKRSFPDHGGRSSTG